MNQMLPTPDGITDISSMPVGEALGLPWWRLMATNAAGHGDWMVQPRAGDRFGSARDMVELGEWIAWRTWRPGMPSELGAMFGPTTNGRSLPRTLIGFLKLGGARRQLRIARNGTLSS